MQGQCGYGTSLHNIAVRCRQDWVLGVQVSYNSSHWPPTATLSCCHSACPKTIVNHCAFIPMQGQCGYGTSLDNIAVQRRQEWALGVQISHASSHSAMLHGHGHGHGHSSRSSSSNTDRAVSWGVGSYLKPFVEHASRQSELQEAQRSSPPMTVAARMSAAILTPLLTR